MLYDIKYCVTFGDVWYAQRILDKTYGKQAKICVNILQYLLKIMRMPAHNSPIRADTSLTYHSCGSSNINPTMVVHRCTMAKTHMGVPL